MATTGCTHRKVTTYVFVDGNEPSGLWACEDCGHKFVPLNISVEKDAERYRKLVATGNYCPASIGIGWGFGGRATKAQLDSKADELPAVG